MSWSPGSNRKIRPRWHLHQSLGFAVTAQMPQVGTKFGRWLDYHAVANSKTTYPRDWMNQLLTLAFLIAAGIGRSSEHADGAHHPTPPDHFLYRHMLLNSLVGIVLFVSIFMV